EIEGGGKVAYLVMEYIEGEPLSRPLAKFGRLTPQRTMALIAQAADALHAAHERGIIHRDVKPGNLLVRPNGTLVLTDFGIARSAMTGQLTAAGSARGTRCPPAWPPRPSRPARPAACRSPATRPAAHPSPAHPSPVRRPAAALRPAATRRPAPATRPAARRPVAARRSRQPVG